MDEFKPLALGNAARVAVQAAAVRVGLDRVTLQSYEPHEGMSVQVHPRFTQGSLQVHPRFTPGSPQVYPRFNPGSPQDDPSRLHVDPWMNPDSPQRGSAQVHPRFTSGPPRSARA